MTDNIPNWLPQLAGPSPPGAVHLNSKFSGSVYTAAVCVRNARLRDVTIQSSQSKKIQWFPHMRGIDPKRHHAARVTASTTASIKQLRIISSFFKCAKHFTQPLSIQRAMSGLVKGTVGISATNK